MNYQEELEMDKMEFDSLLREKIMKTREFQEMFPKRENIEALFSKEEETILNEFHKQHKEIYGNIKSQIEVEFAFCTLFRRCNIELYARLFPNSDVEYEEYEDGLSICSLQELLSFFTLLERVSLRKDCLLESLREKNYLKEV